MNRKNPQKGIEANLTFFSAFIFSKLPSPIKKKQKCTLFFEINKIGLEVWLKQ
jgi:hypothetical protein